MNRGRRGRVAILEKNAEWQQPEIAGLRAAGIAAGQSPEAGIAGHGVVRIVRQLRGELGTFLKPITQKNAGPSEPILQSA